MSEGVRAGCCGWAEGKAKYFGHFAAVELQTTFYEPPALTLAAKWRDMAPPSFEFCIKAWQLITHRSSSPTYRRLKSKLSGEEADLVGAFQPTEQVALAWERTLAIAAVLRASVIVFQCPKSFEATRQNIANLRRFFGEIERGGRQLAWEPRGEWPDDLVRGLCADLDLIHCVDPFDRASVYGETVYWRLHGRTGYRYRYSDEELAELRARLADGPPEAYVMFNNIWMKDDALRFLHGS